MFEQEITIVNPTGLHARPASQLTALCKHFPARITLIAGTNQIDPKSIISILAAGLKCGTTLTVKVEGDDAQSVGEQIVSFIQSITD